MKPKRDASGRSGKVGYGKPPQAHLFKPGRSGNPRGRPKGAKNEATILRNLLNRKIQLRQEGRTQTVTVLEAVLLRFAEEALKGDPKAATFLLNRYAPLESSGGDDPTRMDPDDDAVLEAFIRDLEARFRDKERNVMNSQDQRLLNAILRKDFESFLRRCLLTLNPGAPFLPNWHIRAIGYQLDRIRRGEINRLVINMPPRHLKSLTVSVAFPAFLLGHDPRRRIFAISYGDELSAKHASDFRSIVHSPWYGRAFPEMRVMRSVENDVTTRLRRYRKATSITGTLTGLGGDLFIIDDPQKPADAQSDARRNTVNQWVSNTLISRLDNKETGTIIVVMQRVHADDLSGHLLSGSSDWELLSLPAIAEVDETIAIGDGDVFCREVGEALHPVHESLATLRKLQQTLGSDVFAAQYQQCPAPPGGVMIRREWLRYYDAPPERANWSKVIQSWDTAAKNGAQNDWSVCTTWLLHDEHFYLLHLVRDRFEYPRLRDVAVELARAYRPDAILIEDASTGVALAQELPKVVNFAVKPTPIERDKVGRLYVQQAKFEAGLVHFPRRASFLADLEAELLMFPQGRTDDQVDSISQALAYQASGYDSSMSWVS